MTDKGRIVPEPGPPEPHAPEPGPPEPHAPEPGPPEPHAPEPVAPEPKRRRRGLTRLLAVFIAMALLSAGAAGYVLSQARGEASGTPVTITIPQGATASDIAARLEREGVVRSAFLFRALARMRGVAADLKPGEYSMRTGMSIDAVFDLMAKGPEITFVRLTIPEGRTLRETADIVERTLHIPRSAFLQAASSGRYRSNVAGAGKGGSLEGLLFPDTYFFRENATADDVVRRLVEEFDTKVAGLDLPGRAAALRVSPYQLVTVASLVEDEGKVDVDRPKIASVVYNRLRRGMRLEIDATVQYAIFLRTGVLPNNITVEDYSIEHPYNTYRIPGLPPGPIASPGLASIRAALEPASTPFLYYVLSTDDKTHCFAATYDEFLAFKNRRRSCV